MMEIGEKIVFKSHLNICGVLRYMLRHLQYVWMYMLRECADAYIFRLIAGHPAWTHPHPWYIYGMAYITAGALPVILEG